MPVRLTEGFVFMTLCLTYLSIQKLVFNIRLINSGLFIKNKKKRKREVRPEEWYILMKAKTPKRYSKLITDKFWGFTSSPLIIIILTVDFGERERKRERERESVFERERGRQREGTDE